jgi:hypothetical protein
MRAYQNKKLRITSTTIATIQLAERNASPATHDENFYKYTVPTALYSHSVISNTLIIHKSPVGTKYF